jgi:hypothetical protein
MFINKVLNKMLRLTAVLPAELNILQFMLWKSLPFSTPKSNQCSTEVTLFALVGCSKSVACNLFQ